MSEAEPTLAGVFEPATEEQWLAAVDKVLKGAPLSTLESLTPGGLTVEPLYTRDSSPGGADEAGLPGSDPHLRGRPADRRPDGGWHVRTRVTAADPHDAARLALRDLERGATELTVRLDRSFRTGVRPGDDGFTDVAGSDGVLVTSTDDLDAALAGVLLDVAPVHLEAGAEFARAAEMLLALWERRGHDPAAVAGGIGADPVGTLATTGRLHQGWEAAMTEATSLAGRLAKQHPGVRALRVDTSPFVEAGASEVQELAVMLAVGAEYLRALSREGLAVDRACATIEVSLAADADVFTTVAKLRAARRVWAAMAAACGADDASSEVALHVGTAARMMTRRDPWVNMLRVTAAAFAAGVGGADSVTTAAFDSQLGEPEELGRRIARNTSLLLQAESNLGRVADPAGGSWYVESLSAAIAGAAWEEFGRIEAAGGVLAQLTDGSLAAAIAEVRDARLARIATRDEPLTGVSEFADVSESPVIRTDPDLRTLRTRAVNVARGPATRGAATPTECEPLPTVRWAQGYEHLRDASDAYMAATGARPRVFLVNLGPVAAHTARATFARNLFAAGGIEALTSERGATTGFEDPADAVADALADAAHLVCICGSDGSYAEHAAAFAAALDAAGLGPVYLAGRPGEQEQEWRDAGVSEFVHVGVDVLDALHRAHDHIGTPTGAVSR